jgi:ATP-dependent DNA helicase RecG
MNTRQIKKIILNGENEATEFKSSFDKETIETVCAFSNSNSGNIVLGVNDKGDIVGINIGNETCQNIANQIKQSTYPQIFPDIEVFKINGKNIILISVKSFPIKPVSIKGRYYKRINNSNHLMNAEEISETHLKTYNKSWDYYPDSNHSIQNISFEKVKTIIAEINKRKSVPIFDDTEKVLEKYELIKNNKLTHAGYLLFLKDESVLTTIEAGRFSSETIIKDAISIRTSLFDEVNILLEFIQKHLNNSHYAKVGIE